MKILMVCDFFHENQQYQENLLAKYYLKQGHVVTIVASTFTSIFDYYAGNYNCNYKSVIYYTKGYKVIRQPYSFNLFNKLRKLKNLKKIIKEESPDFIYNHGAPLNLIDSISYKKNNPQCRLVFDSHADYSNSAKNWLSLNILHKIYYKTFFQIYYRKIDKIFFITPNGGAFLNQIYGIPYTSMSMLPLGADTEYINNLNIKEIYIEVQTKLNIRPNDFVIFAGGKLTREKKIELVIKSFFLLESMNTHLIIVGDTKDEKYKKEILDIIKSHPRIHFIGWVDGPKVYDYMAVCDVAVFPASQSVLWQQAIGSGLPLIIGQSKNQDATYLNRNNNLFIIENDSVTPENISSILESLIKDKMLLTKMKMSAIKTTKELLSYELISKMTIR